MSNSDVGKFAGALLNMTPGETHKAIEDALRGRLQSQFGNYLRNSKGHPRTEVLREQASFISGVGAALQCVYGQGTDRLTEHVSPSWVINIIRGELIAEPTK